MGEKCTPWAKPRGVGKRIRTLDRKDLEGKGGKPRVRQLAIFSKRKGGSAK